MKTASIYKRLGDITEPTALTSQQLSKQLTTALKESRLDEVYDLLSSHTAQYKKLSTALISEIEHKALQHGNVDLQDLMLELRENPESTWNRKKIKTTYNKSEIRKRLLSLSLNLIVVSRLRRCWIVFMLKQLRKKTMHWQTI